MMNASLQKLTLPCASADQASLLFSTQQQLRPSRLLALLRSLCAIGLVLAFPAFGLGQAEEKPAAEKPPTAAKAEAAPEAAAEAAKVEAAAAEAAEAVANQVEALLKKPDKITDGIPFPVPEALGTPVIQKTTLFWGSGDSLTGKILAADPEAITWDSELFVDPLKIEISALSAVRFPDRQEASPLKEPFRISMSNGDVLFGKMISATEESIQFHSNRHGEFSLQRNKIESIKRVDTPDLIYLGPRGLEGWEKPQNSDEQNAWRALSNGHLTTSSPDRGIYHQIDFPEKAEIELIIESSKLPHFIFALGQNRTSCVRVESWAEVLVVLSRFQFQEVDTLESKTTRVHLNLFLDQANNRLSIYSNSGEKLTEIVDKLGFFQPTGIQLWNREGDLTLNYLRVDRWNGELPKPLKVGQSRVQTTDGKVIYGTLPNFATGTDVITIQSESEKREIKISNLSNIIVNDGSPAELKLSPTNVAWKEGGFLSGEIKSIHEDRIEIQTPYADGTIASTLSGIQRISFPNNAEPPQNSDQLFFEGGSLHGELVVDGKTKDPIRWTPVGGLNASALSAKGEARFVRSKKGQELSINTDQFPDVLYLLNGDVIPCSLKSVMEEKILLSVPFSEVKEIPTSRVKAVELTSAGSVKHANFTNQGWKRVTGRPNLSDSSITFRTSGAFGNPSIMTGDLVKFKVNWGSQQYSQLIVQLFGKKLEIDPEATSVAIHVNGDKIWVEEHEANAQNARMLGRGFNPGDSQKSETVTSPEGTAEVTLAVRDGQIHVVINGTQLKSIELKNRRLKSRSLVFQANITSVTRNLSYGKNPLTRGIVVENFEVRNHDGASAKQFILEETRDRTLLIPRFRRDNPSTHVLLAPNGDVLRGKLLNITDQQVRFESQLEDFGFERERVAAVIWLHPPKQGEEEKPDTQVAEAHPEIQLRFGRGYSLSMDPQKVVDDQLIGTAQSLGECSIPAASIQEVTLGDAASVSEIVSYSRWIPKFAAEPDWEIPESDGSGPAHQLVGTTAEDFELAGLDGTTFKLSDHDGKVIVLDFWASWCGPCVAALPDYIESTSGFDPEKVIFVAVNLQESPQVVRKFLDEKGLSPQVAMDESGAIGSRFRVSGIPHTVVISPGKTIEQVHIGYRQNAGQNLRQTIEKILDGTWEREAPKSEKNDDKKAEETTDET
ncbi:TlpA family protein disulfide reductase [Thalassoglobus sp.]|uniref:TlpA family protein disulfide reductase n=1 Tax=Thalassoglobus sp. TaxID=2795869 RepID=UPI003AA7DB8E